MLLVESFNLFNPTLEKMDINDILLIKRNSKTLSYTLHRHNAPFKELVGFAFKQGQKFIGWCIAWKNPSKYVLGRKYDLKILNLYVIPEYRRNGFGFDLLKEIMRRQKSICLTVDNRTSHEAKKLFLKLGFKEVDHTPDYGEDSFLWEKVNV